MKWFLPLLLFFLMACQQAPQPKTLPLRRLEVRLDAAEPSATLAQQALLNESGLNFTRIANNTFDVGNIRYIYAQFSIANSTGQPIENLTLYAYHQSANSIGGTALKNIVNFSGTPITDPQIAQSVLPTHKHELNAQQNLQVDQNQADMQGFLPAEAATIKNQAIASALVLSTDDVLEYGYVARTGSSRSIAATGGTVTIAVRFQKNSNPALVPQSFTMTFLVGSELQRRATRDVVDDSSAALQNRDSSAKPFLIGTDDPNIAVRDFSPNLRIAKTPAFLLEPLLSSSLLGMVDLAWDTNNRTANTDSSGDWTFTPLTYSDIDHVAGGFRYLTATFRVDYTGMTNQARVGLRAVNKPSNLASSAVFDVRAFPNSNFPDGEVLTDAVIAQSIVPLHGMQLGFTAPQPDASATAFMAYRRSESLALDAALSGASGLDYGFAFKRCTSTCTNSSYGGTFVNGSLGLVTVSVRIPRNFTVPDPANPPATRVVKPYKFRLSFAITSDSANRVSRALLESTSQAEARASAIGTAEQPTQLILLGTDTETSSATGVYPIRLPQIKLANGIFFP
jgi:hypothetical protein